MNKPSFDNLTFTFVTREEFIPVFTELRSTVFSENNDVDYASYWSADEQTKFKDLQSMCKTEVRSYLLCKDGEKIVGWSFGFQKDAEELEANLSYGMIVICNTLSVTNSPETLLKVAHQQCCKDGQLFLLNHFTWEKHFLKWMYKLLIQV